MFTMRRVVGGLLMAVLASAGGCIMAGKQVFFAIKGSSGDIEVRKAISRNFSGFERVDVQAFGNRSATPVPKNVTDVLEQKIKEELARLQIDKKAAFKAVTRAGELTQESPMPTLIVRGHIAAYEEGSGAGRATGFVGANKLICEVEFVDNTSGEVILAATISGIRKSDIGRDEVDTAVGVAKGIGEAIEDNWAKIDEDYTKVVPREKQEG